MHKIVHNLCTALLTSNEPAWIQSQQNWFRSYKLWMKHHKGYFKNRSHHKIIILLLFLDNSLMIWSASVLSSPPSLLDNPADTAWKWSWAAFTALLSSWLFSSSFTRRSLKFFNSFSLVWSWDWSLKEKESKNNHITIYSIAAYTRFQSHNF